MGKYELPCSISRKLEEFEDFKRTLKQKSQQSICEETRIQIHRKESQVKITALIDSGSTVSLLRRKYAEQKNYGSNKIIEEQDASQQLLDQIFEQSSISFTKEGVKFNKYENHAQLMQISAENLQEELDLRHVENRQIKKELEKLIQDYKPEKQHLLTSQ
ncbi:hypothetical protein TNCV_421111 [Trichonephila clavipes]|nr:hypothetical protein TNCV_421111 [Trichonephila clavipes]